jgi:hypothetical protein
VTFVILWLPVWLSLWLLAALVRAVQKTTFYALVWFWWIGRAHRRVLFVYSNSPNWKDYIEREILPRLPANTVVLNWSERVRWPKLSAPVRLFRCFTGPEEFNPIALVFDRYRFVEQYRFWKPLRDLKHGHPEALRQLEERLFQRVAG